MNPSTSFDHCLQKAAAASPGRWQPFLQEAPGGSPGDLPPFRLRAAKAFHPQEAPGASPGDCSGAGSRISLRALAACLSEHPHRGGLHPLPLPAPDAFRPQEAPGGSPGDLRRSAFTLVELMVVIGIIGLLTAVSVPIVMQSLAKARNAAIKAEIDMLHMAIMNYKNEYGSFPPCVSPSGGAGPAARHIQRIFPRTSNVANEVTAAVSPDNAIVGWLRGYSSDPRAPVTGGTRTKLFDFDESRINASGQYHPSGNPNSPYIYIDSTQYGTPASPNTFTDASGNSYSPQLTGGGFYNPDSFQILCAGRDGEWGPNSLDDLSNFWPGTRGE